MGGHRDPPSDRISALIVERSLLSAGPSGPNSGLAIRVRLARPLPTDLAELIREESERLLAHRKPGILVPRSVEITPDQPEVQVILEAFDGKAVRLDTLLSSLAQAGSPCGSPVSALIVCAVAARLRALHADRQGEGAERSHGPQAEGAQRGGAERSHGVPRGDGDLSPRQVLVGASGGIALVAPGAPALRALICPLESKLVRVRRRAPEVLLGAEASPASDVYTLGALYYELLSGVAYRAQSNVAALRAAARANLDPELPGALPDRRPSLVSLLGACLAPDPQSRPQNAGILVALIQEELAAASIEIADRSMLAGLLQEYVAESASRGPNALIDEHRSPDATSAVEAESSSRENPASGSGWAAVLGTDAEEIPPPVVEPGEARTVVQANPLLEDQTAPAGRFSVPLPEASNPSPLASTEPSPRPVPLTGLEKTAPRKPPTLDDAVRLSPRALLTAASALAIIFGTVGLVGYLRAPAEQPEPDRSLVPGGKRAGAQSSPDTGVTPKQRPKTPRQAKRKSSRDKPSRNRVVPKPLGLVSIISKPSEASVFIDGGFVGKTPLVLPHGLENRRVYRIEVSAEGYADWQKSVRPNNGSISLVIQLEPN